MKDILGGYPRRIPCEDILAAWAAFAFAFASAVERHRQLTTETSLRSVSRHSATARLWPRSLYPVEPEGPSGNLSTRSHTPWCSAPAKPLADAWVSERWAKAATRGMRSVVSAGLVGVRADAAEAGA